MRDRKLEEIQFSHVQTNITVQKVAGGGMLLSYKRKGSIVFMVQTVISKLYDSTFTVFGNMFLLSTLFNVFLGFLFSYSHNFFH